MKHIVSKHKEIERDDYDNLELINRDYGSDATKMKKGEFSVNDVGFYYAAKPESVVYYEKAKERLEIFSQDKVNKLTR